jgi:hypothetical protein
VLLQVVLQERTLAAVEAAELTLVGKADPAEVAMLLFVIK